MFALVLWSSVAGAAAAADSVNTCGILKAFTAPTETNNVGRATVDDSTYYLSGTPGPNTLGPDVTVGRNVCLTGTEVAPETGPTPLLIRWSLTLNPAVSPLPSAVPTPTLTPGATPTGTVASTPPTTRTPTADATAAGSQPPFAMFAGIGAAVLIIALAAFALARRRIRSE